MKQTHLDFISKNRNIPIRERVALTHQIGIKQDHVNQSVKSEQQLLFKKQDITSAKNNFLKLMRLFIHKLGLSSKEYTDIVTTHNIALGKSGSAANNVAHNTKLAIVVPANKSDKDNLTGKKFQQIIEFLGYEFIDLSMAVQDTRTGEIIECKLSDISSLTELDNFKILYDKRNNVDDEIVED